MVFEAFSTAHYSALGAAALVFVAIIIFRKQLRRPQLNEAFRYGLALLLLCCEASLQLSYVLAGRWDAGSMPFQLCSLTLLLSAVLLITRSKRLYAIIFFLGSMGALQALLTPNLDETYPYFRYFHFFLAHIGIISTAIYITVVERYRPHFKSLLSALLWLHVLALPALLTNVVSGHTNFMFLAGKPGTGSLLDILSPWPWYLLELEMVVFLICLLLLAVISLFDFIHRKKRG